jgi:PEP-CTERM motif
MDVRSLRGALQRLWLAAAAILLGTASAGAAVVTVDISSAIVGGYDQYTLTADTVDNGDGTSGLSGIGYGTNFNCDWSILINPDPQITSSFSLTNISAATQTFIMTVTLPIAAIGPATIQGGYFGADANALIPGTRYTDANGDSDVTLATVGANDFYTALVNSVVSQGLGSFTLNANGGPGVYGEMAQQAWGTPIPSASFGPASGNIQIRWQFSLTAGDKVETKGFFQVEPAVVTPEPSSVLLVGLGLAGLVAARKRSP